MSEKHVMLFKSKLLKNIHMMLVAYMNTVHEIHNV